MNPFKDIKVLFDYICMIRRYRPEKVLTYTIKPNLYGGLACRMTHTPCICNVTGLGTAIKHDSFLTRISLKMLKVAFAGAVRVFFQNEAGMRYMNEHGIAVNNCSLLPGSGVNVKVHKVQKYPSEEKGIRLLSVFRIMRDKGIGELLEAMDRVSAVRKDVTFVLAGDYEEEDRDRYEPVITDLVQRGILDYRGYVRDMDALYGECHGVVHPTYHEGMSNVLLEASACGRSVIASDVPGCSEIVEDKVTGLLCEPKSADSLTETIMEWLQLDESAHEVMGKAAASFVAKHFDRQIIIDEYRQLIR